MVRDPAEAKPIVEIEQLSIAYGAGASRVLAVSDASMTIRGGERVALVGESGSGKTSVGMVIGGFADIAGASYEAARFDVAGVSALGARRRRNRFPHARPGVSMVFQNAMTSLDPVWTIGSQFRAALRRESRSRREALETATTWLRRVGLTDFERILRARPYELSGGMRQRVMIALALCRHPALLVADEPTSALDASLSRAVMELLTELSDEFGIALLLVSHDIALCREFSDRTVVMFRGRIVEQLDSARLVEDARHPYTAALLRCVPSLANAEDERLATLADFLPTTQGDPNEEVAA
ncbi:MAG TPA: ABC transporter ATP-binding protein [Microbacteriaceae bacterium]|nr:ABC transporter ATP-binding protein [Microbacteriaceae bacterium]